MALLAVGADGLAGALQQYVGTLPAAAALFQPAAADLPELLPVLLQDAERILEAACQVSLISPFTDSEVPQEGLMRS